MLLLYRVVVFLCLHAVSFVLLHSGFCFLYAHLPQFNCCGLNGPNDFAAPNCTGTIGCLPLMHEVTQSQVLYIAVAGLIIAFVEVCAYLTRVCGFV